jgi:hypothetical protein
MWTFLDYCVHWTSIPNYPHHLCHVQREYAYMGLLEYQAMPSLRAVAHDGWLCTILLYSSSWKFHQLAAGQLLSEQPVRYGTGRRYGPSIA